MFTGTPTARARRGVATDGEDPVTDPGPGQDPGRDGHEEEPPHHGDLDGHTADVEGGREDRLGTVEALRCRRRSGGTPNRSAAW